MKTHSITNNPLTIEERKALSAERRLLRVLNTCTHWDGCYPNAARCSAGIEYASVRHFRPGTGGSFDLPCTNTETDTCAKRQFQTREDYERQEQESRQHHVRVCKIREIITMASAAEDYPCHGSFKCPCCDHGRVRFSVAPNGHASASCSTSGCVDFIE